MTIVKEAQALTKSMQLRGGRYLYTMASLFTMKYIPLIILGTLFLQSCATLRDSPKYQLSEGYYAFRQTDSKYRKAYIKPEDDTLKIYPISGEPSFSLVPYKDEYFRTNSFDIDVMTILFKYRPQGPTIPRQLNTNFNGNVFMGYRVDRFKVDFERTPAGQKKSFLHTGLTVGLFGGIGSTAVNSWTTANQITDEYDGLVLSRGFAAMVGLNSLTVGLGVGWDYLTDRDKNVWVYQNKPWFGLTLGLNLN